MASVYRHARGGWYASLHLASGRRVQLYIGMLNKTQANAVGQKLGDLISSVTVGMPPPETVTQWLAVCDPKFVKRLQRLGILRTSNLPNKTLTVIELFDQYVASRSDFSDNTRKGFQTARHHIAAKLGDLQMDAVTVAVAKQFARELMLKHKPSHAEKIVERAKQVFQFAIDSNRLPSNPFTGIKIHGAADPTRKAYIDRQLAESVLERLPNAESRLLFSLARFCGIRIPHEALALTWDCIDTERARIRIPHNTKTGARLVPLFPELIKPIEEWRSIAPEGVSWVFWRGRASAHNQWARWIKDAIRATGRTEWEKLFINLRSSCRTDLEDRFPSHVCDAWLGHSTRVAKDHYLQVTPEHWATAAHSAQPSAQRSAQKKRAPTGSNGAVRATQKRKNPAK